MVLVQKHCLCCLSRWSCVVFCREVDDMCIIHLNQDSPNSNKSQSTYALLVTAREKQPTCAKTVSYLHADLAQIFVLYTRIHTPYYIIRLGQIFKSCWSFINFRLKAIQHSRYITIHGYLTSKRPTQSVVTITLGRAASPAPLSSP